MPLWLSIGFAIATVLALAACAFLVFTTTPAALKRQITILRAECQETQVAVEAISQRWLAYKAELATLEEAIEDHLDQVDRKQKRIAQRQARENRANGNGPPMTPEEARRQLTLAARAAGFEV